MISKLIKGSFFRNVMVLMSGTAIAQALTIIIAPLLSRLYSPEDFGIFALYTSIVGVLSVSVTFKYEMAILLPKKENEAVNILGLSLLIVTAISIIFIFILMLSRTYIATMFNIPTFNSWALWIPLSLFATGVFSSLNYWSSRRKNFKRVARAQVNRSITVTSVQIMGGLFKKGATGLIGGQVLGQIIAFIVLGKQVWKDDKELIKKAISIDEIKLMARRYKQFPKYTAPQSLINSVSQNITPFILTIFFSPTIVGYYALSLKLLQLPIGLIGNSFKQVYFQQASEINNKGKNIIKQTVTSTFILAGIALIPSIIIIMYSPSLFSFILGEKWYNAGILASWMMVWIFFGFINSPAIVTAQILGLQKILFYYEIILLLSRIIGLIIGAKYFGYVIGIAAYSLIGGLFNFLLIVSVILVGMKKNKDI